MLIRASNTAANYHQLLEQFLPGDTTAYFANLMAQRQLNLRVSKPRKTKLGDYRTRAQGEAPSISLNANLNPYAFAIVLLHEIAHHDSFAQHGPRIKPHGQEWQSAYRVLAFPLLEQNIFPPDLQEAFTQYLDNPSASSCTDHRLLRAMRAYDPIPENAGQENPGSGFHMLDDLPADARFRWRDGRYFVKMHKIRTRIRCYEIHTRRIYLFHPLAEVQPEANAH